MYCIIKLEKQCPTALRDFTGSNVWHQRLCLLMCYNDSIVHCTSRAIQCDDGHYALHISGQIAKMIVIGIYGGGGVNHNYQSLQTHSQCSQQCCWETVYLTIHFERSNLSSSIKSMSYILGLFLLSRVLKFWFLHFTWLFSSLPQNGK